VDIKTSILEFASRKALKLPVEESLGGILTLKIDSPIILARLAAVVRQAFKKQDRETLILCRGQTKVSVSMKPSLFRGADALHIKQLLSAQERVSQRLQGNGPKRFNRPDLPALLQHYGVSTTWLDCVDNLFVAIWFATHRYDPTLNAYAPLAVGEAGWIYFISTRTQSARLKAIDLRDAHHNLCVRPHVQHGWSVTRESPVWSDENRDLREFVPVGVRFENNPHWAVDSGVLSTGLLFPSARDDNTLKVLRNSGIDTILRATEVEQGLSAGCLRQLFVPK
jgi:FRG domain